MIAGDPLGSCRSHSIRPSAAPSRRAAAWTSGIRYHDWKLVYMEQRNKRMDIGRDPLVTLRAPKIFNLRRDPFERADTDANIYDRWWIEHVGNMWPGAAGAAEFFKTFEKFPPHQKPAKFNMDEE